MPKGTQIALRRNMLLQKINTDFPDIVPVKNENLNIADATRNIIIRALNKYPGRRTFVRCMLNIGDRKTFNQIIKRLGIAFDSKQVCYVHVAKQKEEPDNVMVGMSAIEVRKVIRMNCREGVIKRIG